MLVAGVIILFTVLWSCLYVLQRYSKSLKDVGHIPCKKSWHLLGDIPNLQGDNIDIYNSLVKYTEEFREHGLVALWLGIEPLILVFKDEYVQEVIGNMKHIEKSMSYTFLNPWLGNGLLTSTGPRWFKSRKMLTPSFHYNILNSFLIVMQDQSKILCSKLDKMVGEDEFDIHPFIINATLAIIIETAMGQCVNAQENESSEYIENVKRLTDIISYQSRSPWLWPNFLFNLHPLGREAAKCVKFLHDFTNKVIDERNVQYLESLKENSDNTQEEMHGKKKIAFLDTLLDKLHEGEIDKTMLREEVDTFMFEGHDTTSAGLTWTLYFIAAYPNVQKKLQKEVDDYYGVTEEHTLPNLKKMVYLECVIKEVQRTYPSVPNIGRIAAEDFKIGPYEIKKGTQVTIQINALHKDPKNFPDPNTFDPDRFLTEVKSDRHPYAFIPFSAGPRNCIGQKFAMAEEKVVLSRIIQMFNLETTQQREELKPTFDLVLKPSDGIRVKLTRR